MKIILVGYPGSQHIVPASKYLLEKYLPGFDLHFLNYTGPKEGWSDFIKKYLEGLDDELIIFALDDYLVSDPINMADFDVAVSQFNDEKFGCIKLCETTLQEHSEYPVTTQYTIWRRKALIEILNETKDPWHFEITGSSIWRAKMPWHAMCVSHPIIKYDVHSCLSSRWPGIKWSGIKQEDLRYIKNNQLIK